MVCAGDFPTHSIPLAMLDSTPRIVCCDGATQALVDSGRTPWRIVGDFDSVSNDMRRRFADIMRHNPDQETNDQTKAIKYLAAKGLRRIAIVGATGKREDHSLGNIALVPDYLSDCVDARMYTDFGVFIPSAGDIDIHTGCHAPVSVFNFGATALAASGLQWPLRPFDRLWQGTLNRSVSPTVRIRANGPILVYLPYQF